MIIHIFTVAYNERQLLPFFLRHYQQFADRIVVFDNNSTDGTAEIARAAGCEVIPFDTGGTLDEVVQVWIKSTAWKASRGVADWVVCCDVDEFLWHADLLGYLERLKAEGTSIPVPSGFQMISDAGLPRDDGRQLWEVIREGARDDVFARKCLVFDPNAIDEISYTEGCHHCRPRGHVIYREPSELLNLHYHNLGIDYLMERYATRRPRITQDHRDRGWLCYDFDRAYLEGRQRDFRDRAVEVTRLKHER